MVALFRYCLIGFFSLASLASGANRTIIIEPSELARTWVTGQPDYAFSDSRSWDVVADVPAGHAKPKLPVISQRGYSWPNLRGTVKNALKLNPASLAGGALLTGLLAGLDYVMNPENTGLLGPDSGDTKQDINTFHWLTNYDASDKFYSPPETKDYVISRFHANNTPFYIKPETMVYSGSTWYASVYRRADNSLLSHNWNVGNVYSVGSCSSPYVLTNQVCIIPNSGGRKLVSDAELDSLVNQIDQPSEVESLLPDLENIPGSFDYPDSYTFDGPSSVTGESITSTTTTPDGTTVTSTTPTYNFDYSTNPLSITTTTVENTTVYQDGNLISTTNSTNAGTITETPKLEIPTDCEFMPTVCAFLDWFQTPTAMPEPDMPEPVEDDFERTYSASFGGSCPAPRTVSTQFGQVSLSWEPLCDLAGYIKFLVIGSAALYAAFIALGISRGNA